MTRILGRDRQVSGMHRPASTAKQRSSCLTKLGEDLRKMPGVGLYTCLHMHVHSDAHAPGAHASTCISTQMHMHPGHIDLNPHTNLPPQYSQ